MIPFLDLKKVTDSFQPQLDEATTRVAHSGFFIRGEEVRRFEEEYGSFIGTRCCVGVGNGFDALPLSPVQEESAQMQVIDAVNRFNT